jgi:hypothetical protein
MCAAYFTLSSIRLPSSAPGFHQPLSFASKHIPRLQAYFWVDIFLNFRTGYVEICNVEMRGCMIAKHYLQNWFFIDLVSSLPISYIQLLTTDNKEGSSHTRTLKILRLMRLSKLLRMRAFMKFIKGWEDSVEGIENAFKVLGCLAIGPGPPGVDKRP